MYYVIIEHSYLFTYLRIINIINSSSGGSNSSTNRFLIC